jgi:hypothetical protein
MLLLDVYLVIAIIGVLIASVYQGYCDAKHVENKLASLVNFYIHDKDNEEMVMVLIIFWPVTLFILMVYLFVLVIGFPFWFAYKVSKNYFSKDNI